MYNVIVNTSFKLIKKIYAFILNQILLESPSKLFILYLNVTVKYIINELK